MRTTSLHALAFPALALILSLIAPGSSSALDATGIVPTKVSVDVSSSNVPIGTIIAWPADKDPDNPKAWLDCNGQTISAADYPKLTAVLAGDSASQAVIPDLRGLFLRGYGQQVVSQANGTAVGTTQTTHASGALLAVQGDAARRLYGTLPVGGAAGVGSAVNANLTGVFGTLSTRSAGFEVAPGKTSAQAYFDSQRTVPTDVEIRPANMAVRYLIRAL